MTAVLFAVGILLLLAVFLGWYQERTRRQGERWLRQEGYLPPTPEEAEQARREKLYGKFRQ
jgi:Flp pilus assembly protein TadB